MSDHDFEKQVQLRLEQLKLRPSNAVWAEVERNIRLQKRRRRLLIWLPAALLVMIAGGYLVLQQTGHQDIDTAQTAKNVVNTTPATTTPVSPNQTPSTHNSTSLPASQPDRPAQNNDIATPDHASVKPVTPPAATTNTSEPAATTATQTDRNKPRNDQRQPKTDASVAYQQPDRLATAQQAPVRQPGKNNTTTNKPLRAQQQGGEDIAARKPSAAASLPVLNVLAPVTKPTADSEKDPSVDATIAVVPNADSALAIITPDDSLLVDSTATLAKAPVAQTPPAPAVATLQPKKDNGKESKWQFGVNVEGGASGVSSDGLFGFLETKEAVPDLAAAPNYNFSGNSQTFAPQFPRPPVNRASSLSMGPAFSIGGFAQRKLNNRLSLSAGIQYTFLSARQIVGNKYDNNRTVNRAPATSQLVASYYDNSINSANKYTNKYHFIELPITLHAQLNEGKRLPFGLDVGFSASRMLKTTALHYDGIGNVYYKDDALFNKTQWTASAGFYVKLFNQSGHPLSVGPMMRYNMTPMLVKDFSTGQHLWSVGLRASVLLKK